MSKEREIAKFITVLDFEVGEVFQYETITTLTDESYEKYLSDKGHNLKNCQWMIHDSDEIIKE